MRQVIIDGRVIADRQALHQALAAGLALPEWYGNNLDALSDCLSEVSEDTVIAVTNFEDLEAALGRYAHSLLKVLWHAAEENPHIRLI